MISYCLFHTLSFPSSYMISYYLFHLLTLSLIIFFILYFFAYYLKLSSYFICLILSHPIFLILYNALLLPFSYYFYLSHAVVSIFLMLSVTIFHIFCYCIQVPIFLSIISLFLLKTIVFTLFLILFCYLSHTLFHKVYLTLSYYIAFSLSLLQSVSYSEILSFYLKIRYYLSHTFIRTFYIMLSSSSSSYILSNCISQSFSYSLCKYIRHDLLLPISQCFTILFTLFPISLLVTYSKQVGKMHRCSLFLSLNLFLPPSDELMLIPIHTLSNIGTHQVYLPLISSHLHVPLSLSLCLTYGSNATTF